MIEHGVIYKITNIVTEKVYIGQTVCSNFDARIRSHLNGNGGAPRLSNSIKHHGKDKFSVEVLLCCLDLDTLNIQEIEYIKKHDCLLPNGYNIKHGGLNDGKLGEETKELISKKVKEYYRHNDNPLKGKKFSKEHVENLSKVRKGFTSEARRLAHKNTIEKLKKPIIAVNTATKKEERFSSISECARNLNLQAYNISRVLNKKQGRTQHKGYKFKWESKSCHKEKSANEAAERAKARKKK